MIAFEVAPSLRRWFYFMNFGWGKGLILLAMLSFELRMLPGEYDKFNYFGTLSSFHLLCALVCFVCSACNAKSESRAVQALIMAERERNRVRAI